MTYVPEVLRRVTYLVALLIAFSTGLIQAQELDPATEIGYDLDWRTDGEILAVAGDQHVWLLDRQYRVVNAYPYPSNSDNTTNFPLSVEWSPNGEWLASIHLGGILRVWSFLTGELIFDADLNERTDPDTIRWHPSEPLLSTFRYIVNVETGRIEQPYTIDMRAYDAPSGEQHPTGEVFWSPDGIQMIRHVSDANCGPCSEYAVFDIASGELIQSLGLDSGAWDTFVWSSNGRFRTIDHVLIGDLLFNADIERVVYVETGTYESFRMSAIVVVNSFLDEDVINHQVAYPKRLLGIDWMPERSYIITALNCAGEIISIDIRDMDLLETINVFASDVAHCRDIVFPGYTNP